jgi:uncharacterized protein YbjT (DUF2867 family)
MILVTGATGNVGKELVKKLSTRGERVRAFVRCRSQRNAIALPGAEFVEGDFYDFSSFVTALTAVDRLFLLIPSSPDVERQQKEFVDVAQQKGVRHIVYLSQLGADEHSTKGRFQRYHGAVESHIRKSGISFTFLRPNLFMQALLNFRASISSQGALCVPAGNAKISVVDVRDIAAVAERALTEAGHNGKVYEITGPESLTHGEMAATLSLVLGKPVKHVDLSSAAMREALLWLAALASGRSGGRLRSISRWRGRCRCIDGAGRYRRRASYLWPVRARLCPKISHQSSRRLMAWRG